MNKMISKEQFKDYKRDGVLFPIPVLPADDVSMFRSALEELEIHFGGKLKRIDFSHLFFPWAYNLATHPRLLDVMEELLGPDLFIHSTRVFYKHPHDPSYVSWHQDGIYSNLNSKPAPSIWIALTDSTVENGCLRVIRGSHQQDKRPHAEIIAHKSLLNHGEILNTDIDEDQAVDVILNAGEMSIHHVNAIHGSNPNQSNTKRIGFTMTFMKPEVRHSHLPVVRARGHSDDHEFNLVEGPPDLSLDEAVTAHAEFIRQHGMRQARVER